jgi:hypothetical protein
MNNLHSRTLPRLVLDTVHCLHVAYDDIDHERRTRTRDAINSLHSADVTDIESAISMLRNVAHHLREIETILQNDRPFTAGKVRGVRHRVELLGMMSS